MQHLDEGFFDTGASEAAMDDPTEDQDRFEPNYFKLLQEVFALPLEQRIHMVQEITGTFPTSLLFRLHNQIGSMVYFDPVQYLPNELILSIFSHMTPKDLLIASQVSKSWRELTQDEQLWSDCFSREGWVLDKARIAAPQDLARRNGAWIAERIMRNARPLGLQRRSSRKRPRDEAFNSESESAAVTTEQEELEGQEEGEEHDGSDNMQGVEDADTTSDTTAAVGGVLPENTMTAQDALMDFDHEPSSSALANSLRPAHADPIKLKIHPTVFSTAREEPKVSWAYLYKHRRRLEQNWDKGNYTMFRLPDPNHTWEGHQECVYTIQHSGKWLVSGSRDKTIRIWDLDTYRLKGQPLQGHEASVLCLQFDERPDEEHDIIISGGSDNYVIAWRFSTGEKITKFEAHKESVLNLRFDDRYLVTCSKDKTIKIWNRHEITSDDPIIPRMSVSLFHNELKSMIPPFTHLRSLTGHQAAVNAVQISGDTIVSASGDRTIKSWEIHGDGFKRSYTGHTKGIACVQFDGRRIVSGSSDNTVRIFDYDTSAEVACLDGHTNLVRTVQARFGDLQITSDEELHAEARAADREFLKAINKGMQPAEASRRRRPRNAGSRQPQEMLSYGTKVPPGGGGGRWAKIVSGSYDETVIIWKRDEDGNWVVKQRLHQGMLLRHPNSTRVHATAVRQPANLNQINAQTIHTTQVTTGSHAQQLLNQAQNQLHQVNTILQQPALGQGQLPQAQLNPVNAAHTSLNAQIQALASQQHQHAIDHGAAAAQAAPSAITAANLIAQHNQQSAANHGQHAQAQAQTQNGHAPHPHSQAHHANAPAQGHHHHPHHHHQGPPNQRESNRVFKLQFDARRIIACSQNKVIVGWDFANGDKDLEWVGDWSVETP